MDTTIHNKEIFSIIAKEIGITPVPIVDTFVEEYSTYGKHSRVIIHAPHEHIGLIDEFLLKSNIVAEKEMEKLIIKIA